MSIKINFRSKTFNKSSTNSVLFTDDKFNIKPLKKFISSSQYSYISDLLKSSDLKKKMLVFEFSSKKKNNFNFN